MLPIKKQQFVNCINLIHRLYQDNAYIDEFVKHISEEGKCIGAHLSEILVLEELLISLLEPTILDPSESLIGFFIYELEFGTRPITQKIDFTDYIIDSNTDITTAEKLYDFLEQKYNENKKEINNDKN